MVAGDNDTVAALAAVARAERVTAGQVTEEGVGTRDGAIAGVGDIIVTRRNDRELPAQRVGANGRQQSCGYVRNRDRWTVTDAGADGRLEVVHQRTGATATLPATYVRQHVELGYATTAHGAQGLTVDEAHAVIGPDDPASLAYVALTRGRTLNQAHVVTVDLDVRTEDHQMHRAPQDARSVLTDVLARDDPATARGQWAQEVAHEQDPAVLVDR